MMVVVVLSEPFRGMGALVMEAVELPKRFRGMGALRNSAENQHPTV